MLKPNEREFEALAAQGYNLIPVWREIAADLETPVSAFLKVARGEYAFLLESVQGGEKWGRYTFLGSEPAMVMRGRGGRLDLTRPGRSVEVRSVKSPLEGSARRDAPLSRLSVARVCRASSAARSAFSPTTSRATSSACPRMRTTNSARPTST